MTTNNLIKKFMRKCQKKIFDWFKKNTKKKNYNKKIIKKKNCKLKKKKIENKKKKSIYYLCTSSLSGFVIYYLDTFYLQILCTFYVHPSSTFFNAGIIE